MTENELERIKAAFMAELVEISGRLGESGGRFSSYREMSAAAKCLRAVRDACRFGKP